MWLLSHFYPMTEKHKWQLFVGVMCEQLMQYLAAAFYEERILLTHASRFGCQGQPFPRLSNSKPFLLIFLSFMNRAFGDIHSLSLSSALNFFEIFVLHERPVVLMQSLNPLSSRSMRIN